LSIFLSYYSTNSLVYKFDHVWPAPAAYKPVVVLYGELGTPQMTAFHQALAQKAAKQQIQYVLRHFVKVGDSGF
jgi:hypothetical protein